MQPRQPRYFRSVLAEREYAALVGAADDLLIGLDFDGTLAPIVADPESAYIHPEAGTVLIELAAEVAQIAVVTGRPAGQVLSLGGLDEVGAEVEKAGHELLVLGQYGNERWSSTTRRVISPEPPPGLSGFLRELPELLSGASAEGVWIEEKGLAVAVHTRRCADPVAAYERLLPALSEAARGHSLDVEPGRLVIEVRAPGMDKGQALSRLVTELGSRAVAFIGDDLGDVPAFEAVARLRDSGMPTLLVCSGSEEESALRDGADVVVDGVAGVLELLRELTADIRAIS